MRRLVSIATGVTVIVAAWCVAVAPGAVAKTRVAHVSAADVSTITWGACSESDLQELGAQCGFLSVPLDYNHPFGAHIQLAVSRLLHTSSDADYQGAILSNPGGPGGSGLDLSAILADTLAGEGYTSAAADYDWIGFDPRGVGSSQPALSCDPNYFSADRPNYVPFTGTLLNFWESKSDFYGQECATASPQQKALLQNDTTRDSALDMDSIRRALGQQQISYYGFSYGTYLGQVYSTLFPSRVRRLILDSNVDPRDVWYQANLRQDIAFNRNANIWFAWLAKYDSVYHLGTTALAVSHLFNATKRQLAVQPAGGVVGPDEWVDIFLGAGYYQQTWLDLGQAFSDWVNNHDAAAAENLIEEYQSADGVGDDNGYAGYLAVECGDTAWPSSWSKIVNDNWGTYLGAPFSTWANAWFNGPCTNWPAQPSTPVQVDGSQVSSALLIDETLDAATPFEGSLEVRKLFPHASLLAEPGGTTHADSLFGNACVDDTIADYLTTGALPARRTFAPWDKTCAPLPVPDPTAAPSPAAAKGTNSAAARAQQQFSRAVGRLGLAAVTAR